MSVRDGLLALLADGPSHGYQLKTAFESATGGAWPLNVGQVYTTLDRLHRDGLVSVDEAEEQKRYTLTPDGEAALGTWWTTVPEASPPPRDELLIKVLVTIDRSPQRALEVITSHRTALLRMLQAHRRATRPAGEVGNGEAGSGLAGALIADALVVRAEADLRWLDLCEARLERIRTDRPDAP